MIGPFVLMPMCDCTVDEKTRKKTCKPFLRAFVLGCHGLEVKGDYDYDAKPYKPEGEVSSEAKCCDCCDCGSDKEKSKACYDVHCLLRQSELNGGLTNLQITGPDGTLGQIVIFDPPALTVQTVFNKLNDMAYLGFTTWMSSGPGLLCVEFEKGASPPGTLTSCRFKRFTVASNNALKIAWYNAGNPTGFATCADNYAVLDPSSTIANIQASNIHYLCNLRYVDTYANTNVLAVPGNLTNNRLFRTTFSSNSQNCYVHQSTSALAADVLSANITTGYASVINALPAWFTSVLAIQGINATAAISAIGSPQNATGSTQHVDFNLQVDMPCRYNLSSMTNVTATSSNSFDQNNQIVSIEVDGSGNLLGMGADASHLHTFVLTPSVGTFVAEPAIDGEGGSTNTDMNCEQI